MSVHFPFYEHISLQNPLKTLVLAGDHIVDGWVGRGMIWGKLEYIQIYIFSTLRPFHQQYQKNLAMTTFSELCFYTCYTTLKYISAAAWERRRRESGRRGEGEVGEEELGYGDDG